MRPSRAVVFDLDDTLYPYRRFQLSGFQAAAAHLERRAGLDRRLGFRAMHRASRGTRKGQEIQACLAQYDLPASLADEAVDVLRHHEPRLRLSNAVHRTIGELRRNEWSIGVLTNGSPTIQARKIDALGIGSLVDTVVFAAECGAGVGKPDPEAFAEVLRRFEAPAGRTVMVGNDEVADVGGAVASGLSVVRCDVWGHGPHPTRAQAVIKRFADLPDLLARVLEEDVTRHAA